MTSTSSQLNSHEIQNYVKSALGSEPSGSQGLDSHSAIVKQTIKQMLDKVGFEPHSVPFTVDKELELFLREDLLKLNLDATSFKQAEKGLVFSVSWAHQAWTCLARDVKAVVAKQLLYIFLIDDFAEDFMEDLMRFGERFIVHAPHNSPILQAFDNHLRTLGTWYGPYSVTAIVKNSLEYVTGRVVEHQMLASQFHFSPAMKLVPVFLRPKVGGSEIMSHMVFDQARFPEDQYLLQYLPAIPAMMQFADYTNDILSYYKEFVIADEKFNFVDNFAKSHGLSHIQVLCSLAEHATEVQASGRQLVSHDPKLLEVYDQWIRGYIHFFTAHRRYHLVELFASEDYLPPYHEDS
ncbi:Trichodiene synthase [Penicillium cf. griseofulvum]|uniref:Trichodiene synthase n=1 Tax=Penicillium cf. griseofulvum TaxID=2972120 RepID=A0A9W9J032_9EURO|nr:Trichodiene synthase [Penicillium cf. griseofulvum]KAJ5422865.1 Trichodiene synthase [Penicillium cf. griseofulvum]KAJ5433918.1 Trichodiene synthase [Penicillium cf. griseofulvum]